MNERLKSVSIILRASQHLSNVLKKDIESYGLNTTEFGTLELLYHKGPHAIQQISDKMLLANSSMTYVIDKLEQKQLVRRQSDLSDRRVYSIVLTDNGIRLMEEIFPKHTKQIDAIFAILSNDEVHQMNELLKKVGKHCEALLNH